VDVAIVIADAARLILATQAGHTNIIAGRLTQIGIKVLNPTMAVFVLVPHFHLYRQVLALNSLILIMRDLKMVLHSI